MAGFSSTGPGFNGEDVQRDKTRRPLCTLPRDFHPKIFGIITALHWPSAAIVMIIMQRHHWSHSPSWENSALHSASSNPNRAEGFNLGIFRRLFSNCLWLAAPIVSSRVGKICLRAPVSGYAIILRYALALCWQFWQLWRVIDLDQHCWRSPTGSWHGHRLIPHRRRHARY